jgi:hypothetical protein
MMSRYTVHELAGFGIPNEIVQEISAGSTGNCVVIALHLVKE